MKNYFPQLTGLRAIAAYMVYFFHTLSSTHIPADNGFDYILQTGYLGVSVFFVLSGFLICYRYSDNFKLSKQWFQNYMINRIARIYPLFFILTVFTFIYNHYFEIEKNDFIIVFSNLTFIRGYFNNFLFTGITQGWSLTVEETFYVLAPLLFLVINKKKSLLFLFLIFVTVGVSLVFVFRTINFYGFMNDFKLMINYTFFGRCLEFLLGIKIALLFKTQQELPFKLKNYTYMGIVLMMLVVLIMSLSKAFVFESNIMTHEIIMALSNNLFFPFGVACFMYGLIVEKSLINKLFSTTIFQVLGKSSYAFYLIHVGFISYFIGNYFQTPLIVHFVIINVLSIIFYYFIENPMNKLIRKIAVKK